MIGHLNSTIEGLISVRACKKQDILRSEFDEHQNYHISAQFIGMATWKLVQLYCHMICALYVGAILVTFMIFKSGKSEF